MRLNELLALVLIATPAACDRAEAPTPADAAKSGVPLNASLRSEPVAGESSATAKPTPSLKPPAPRSGGRTIEPLALPPEADCGASELGSFVGARPSEDTLAAIRKRVGEHRIRTIRPGDVVTMDYSESRLNVEVGEDGRIERFRCG